MLIIYQNMQKYSFIFLKDTHKNNVIKKILIY